MSSWNWSVAPAAGGGLLVIGLAVLGLLYSSTTKPPRGAFDVRQTIQETRAPSESSSRTWWLSSGGRFSCGDGMGSTIHGDLPQSDRWRRVYSRTNPLDTDSGLHPQNVFRLVTKHTLAAASVQQCYFKINAYRASPSRQRNGSNGVFLMNRYGDADNLYYTGVRVDGLAVVKKKADGTYATLASKPVMSGAYDRDSHSNLLPLDLWIGLRSECSPQPNGSLKIELYLDIGRTGTWTRVIETTDATGSAPLSPGRGGIRTDFMDAQFATYSARFQ